MCATQGLRSPLPQRCKAAGKQGGHLPTSRSGLSGLRKARLQEELTSRGLDASGNKPILVSRLHEALTLDDMDVEVSGMAAQRLSPLEREAAPVEVNHELLALREKVTPFVRASSSLHFLPHQCDPKFVSAHLKYRPADEGMPLDAD